MGRLGLSDAEEDALVSFMQTLTDGFMPLDQRKRHRVTSQVAGVLAAMTWPLSHTSKEVTSPTVCARQKGPGEVEFAGARQSPSELGGPFWGMPVSYHLWGSFVPRRPHCRAQPRTNRFSDRSRGGGCGGGAMAENWTITQRIEKMGAEMDGAGDQRASPDEQ